MIASALLSLALAADPTAANAVQKEMALLHEAVVVTLVGIENGDVSSVPEAFQKVHAAKRTTEAAIKAGEWKPRPGSTVAAFQKQDDAYHHELERLVKAASKKDVAGTAKQLGAVINGCPACHAKFRPDPVVPSQP